MSSNVTTSIRWQTDELADVREAASQLGLPVSLFVKAIALSQVRNVEIPFNASLKDKILEAKQEADRGFLKPYTKSSFLKELKGLL